MAIVRSLQQIGRYAVMLAVCGMSAQNIHAQRPRPAPAEKPAGAAASAHIQKGSNVNFPWQATDGNGYAWDIQYYGTVGNGANNVYSNGMFLYVNSNNFYPSDGTGWSNKAGDEVEVGPQQIGGSTSLKVYRRIKVYKDAGMARWLEIIENNSSQNATANIQIMNNLSYGFRQTTMSGGGNKWTDNDWACITVPNDGGANTPSVLHILCDAKAKTRPTLVARGSNLTARYTLNIPPKTTYIICSFEAQGRSQSELQKLMKDFKAYKYLKDLPQDVRKLIVNISAGADYAQIDLERGEASDMVTLAGGNPVYGQVLNDSFRFQTRFGPIDVPAGKIIGMAATKAQDGTMLAVLTDGQVVSGKLADEKLRVRPSTGGELAYPFSEIAQWSYRISPEKPEETKFLGPYLLLRTGDRFAYDGDSLPLTLQTQHGPVKLSPPSLLTIKMDSASNALHQVVFLNESTLGGLIEPAELSPALRLGPKVKIPRGMIAQVQFAPELQAGAGLTRMTLVNGDELMGRLTDAEYKLAEKFAPQPNPLKPQNIRNISFRPGLLGMAEVTIWDNSVRKGMFQNADFNFEIMPGPTLKISSSQIVSVELAQPTPPDEIVKEVEKLVAQLASESHVDREKATEALTKKGSVILVLLKKHQNAADPEVRQRIQKIIETIDSSGGQQNVQPDDSDESLPRMMRMRGG
ncbi:MAG: hypothetical protein HZA50_05530 [Planctomycetes bacterium]|nr:hypothetical protein [Planctomycetota bacterium]